MVSGAYFIYGGMFYVSFTTPIAILSGSQLHSRSSLPAFSSTSKFSFLSLGSTPQHEISGSSVSPLSQDSLLFSLYGLWTTSSPVVRSVFTKVFLPPVINVWESWMNSLAPSNSSNSLPGRINGSKGPWTLGKLRCNGWSKVGFYVILISMDVLTQSENSSD